MTGADELWVELACKDCSQVAAADGPLGDDALASLADILGPGWVVDQGQKLVKCFACEEFHGAMSFANRVGELADTLDHHPDLHISWGMCRVEIWTHAVAGLTENDFILAAKIDQLPDGG